MSGERRAESGKAIVRSLGRVEYEPTWRAMQAFTSQRVADTPDELWLLEHPPVYTLGQAGKREHLIAATDVPVVPIDRGGQITYHGPGQIVGYPILDLNPERRDVHKYVRDLEEVMIRACAAYGVEAGRVPGLTGAWIAHPSRGPEKIGAIGVSGVQSHEDEQIAQAGVKALG